MLLFLKSFAEETSQVLQCDSKRVEIVTAALGEDSGVLGAAGLALERLEAV